MRFSNRYFKLLALFFAFIVVKKFAVVMKPSWEPVLNVLGPLGILILMVLILKAIQRDYMPTPAERALQEAQRQQQAINDEQQRIEQEIWASEEEARRLARNARQRLRRAEKRALDLEAQEAKKNRPRKRQPETPQEPKSRWDRLLSDDEE